MTTNPAHSENRVDKKTLRHHLATFESISWTRPQAEVLYRLLMQMGAANDMYLEFNSAPPYTRSRPITVNTTFKYAGSIWDEKKQQWVEGELTGYQVTPLGTYIKKLIRFDRAAHKRMKNVEQKVNRMHQIVAGSVKQMKG